MNELSVAFHDFYAFLLILARVSGLIATAPLFGNRMIPLQAKAGFAVLFSFIVTPMVVSKTGGIPSLLLVLVGQVLVEALFGLAFGYMTRLLFGAIEMAGYFIDTQMGFGFISLINPFAERQSSAIDSFQYQLAMTLYLLMNGHLFLLGAMVESFQVLPPGGFSPTGQLGMAALPMLTQMFALGFKLALPAAGVLFLLDVAFGLVARMVPQMNVFMVGVPAKIVLGMLTVVLILPAVAIIVGEVIAGTSVGLQAVMAGVSR